MEYKPQVYNFACDGEVIFGFYDGVSWERTTEQHYNYLLNSGAEPPSEDIEIIRTLLR